MLYSRQRSPQQDPVKVEGIQVVLLPTLTERRTQKYPHVERLKRRTLDVLWDPDKAPSVLLLPYCTKVRVRVVPPQACVQYAL